MGKEDEQMKVPAALSKLDTSGILFFLGILVSIGVLDKTGLLKDLAIFPNDNLLVHACMIEVLWERSYGNIFGIHCFWHEYVNLQR